MPAPAWEIPGDFLSVDDFAIEATFRAADGRLFPGVRGIFDDAVMNEQTGEYEMAAGVPRFTCPFGAVSALKRHDTAVIDGRDFTLMHDPRPDGTGWALIEFAEDFPAGGA